MSTEQVNELLARQLGITPSQARDMLRQACADNTITRVFKWHKRFEVGHVKVTMTPGAFNKQDRRQRQLG